MNPAPDPSAQPREFLRALYEAAVARARPGVNMNALLDDTARDPLSGNAVLSGVAVEIEPA